MLAEAKSVQVRYVAPQWAQPSQAFGQNLFSTETHKQADNRHIIK